MTNGQIPACGRQANDEMNRNEQFSITEPSANWSLEN